MRMLQHKYTSLNENACLELLLGDKRSYVGNLLAINGNTALLDSTSTLGLRGNHLTENKKAVKIDCTVNKTVFVNLNLGSILCATGNETVSGGGVGEAGGGAWPPSTRTH